MSAINFNPREVAPDAGRLDPMPTGWYTFVAKKATMEPTAGGGGKRVAAQFQVVDGNYKGQSVFHNFNWENDSEDAVKIGRAQLSAFCHAVEFMDATDTNQWLNIPFRGRVKVVPAQLDTDGKTVKYEAKNEMTAFKTMKDPAAWPAAGAATVSKPVIAVRPPPGAGAPPPPGTVPPPQASVAQAMPKQPWEDQTPAAVPPAQTEAPQAPVTQAPPPPAAAAPVFAPPPPPAQVAPQGVPPVPPQAEVAAPVFVAPPTAAAPPQPVAEVVAPVEDVPPWLQGNPQ